MEQRINIAELLKDCPKGTKLYSPIFGDVYLDKIRPHLAIVVTTDKEQGDFKEEFLYDGRYGMNGECMLFPSKGKTTWERFQKPFKDGDILTYMFYNKPTIYIYRKSGGYNTSYYVAYSSKNEKFYNIQTGALAGNRNDLRFATEEEKQKLFDVIKANGYKWNAETKTLKKLIEPKFKVGDKIVKKDIPTECWYVQGIKTDCNSDYFYYIVTKGKIANLYFKYQDEWELDTRKLDTNKFDISTLKAYDKVLVRNDNNSAWINTFFGFYDIVTNKKYPFIAGSANWAQCIPYEGNEHLLGKTDDCDDYFKTWE